MKERTNSYLGKNIKEVLDEIYPNILKNINIYPTELDDKNNFVIGNSSYASSKIDDKNYFLCITSNSDFFRENYFTNNDKIDVDGIQIFINYNEEGRIHRIQINSTRTITNA